MPVITVDQNTKLTHKGSNDATDIYDVCYYGHETGVVVEVPADATPADVLIAYLANPI